MTRFGLTAASILVFATCSPEDAGAQDSSDENTPRLTIERLYDSPSLTGPAPQALAFSPDGTRVTFLRAKEEDRTVLDLWAMDVDDAETYRLVDARALAPEERELSEAEIQYRERARISESGVVSYDWDQSGEAVLVPLDGDVFYVDVESGEATRLMETEAFETDAKVSPGGRYVSFIRDQNLWVHDLETGEARALTSEGGGTVSWGVAEFVAQEEMSRYTGYWWSPDDRYVAVTRIDESPVMVVERFGISAEGASVSEQRYPRAGTDNVMIELHVIDMETGERRRIDLGEETDIYLARAAWSEDGETLYAQRQNRDQTRLDLLAADPGTGETEIVLSEEDPAWINLTDDFIPLSDGGFLWTSERTGFRHIYRYDADGNAAALTSGDWVVDRISGVDEENGRVFFEGWTETPLERHVYVVSMDGSGAPERITSGEGWWDEVAFNEGASAFTASYSDPQTPPQTALYSANGERIAWLEENALDGDHPYAPYRDAHVTPEFGTIKAGDGETGLYWMMYRPETCTAQSPCAALVQVYGGPHVQTVSRRWQNPRDQFFAQNGYVLFKLDNRGMWNRGHAFEAAIHDRMGSIEVDDQVLGLEFLESQDFVDEDRVGLWGWSYGGYMTLMTALQAPGAFDAAAAGAPVTDWSLYDTHYTERYMDTPQANAEGYQQGSVFAHLDGYETPMLLIHGMSDDNVTFDHSTRLYAELQERGEAFEMMTYPGQRHGIRPPALQKHLLRTITDFFEAEIDARETE